MRRIPQRDDGWIALVAGGFAMLAGTGALLGWFADWDTLLRYRAGWPAMPPAMAIGLLGCGVAALSDGLARARSLGLFAAGVAVAMGVLGVAGLDLAPTRWIARGAAVEVLALPLTTAACLLLAGSSLFLLRWRRELASRAPLLFWISGVIVACMAGAALVTQLVGVGLYYDYWRPLSGMAVPTALSLLALGCAVLTNQGRTRAVARSHFSWLGIGVGGVTGLAVLALWAALVGEERRHIERTVQHALSNVRFHVTRYTHARVENLVRMADRWAVGRDPLREEWEADAKLNVFHDAGVEAIAWVDPTGVPRLLVAQPHSEIDADFVGERVQIDEPRQMREARIASSFLLADGQRAFPIYAPILRDGSYRGSIAAVIRADAALGPALLNTWEHFDIDIRDGGEPLLSLAHGEKRARLVVEGALFVVGATWTVRVWPRSSWLGELQSAGLELALGVGLALAMLAGSTVSLARTAQHRLRSVHGLLESAPDSMVVVDREGGVLLVNKETERLFGCGRAELVGGRIDGILPEWSELLDRSGLGRDPEESDRHPRGPHEVVARRRDGSSFPAEIVLSPVASERGPLVSAAIRDLTGRRDEELRRRLAAIVTTSGDAILSMRPDGTIVDWNPGAERNYGWSAREAIGRHISVLEPEEIAGEMDALLERVRLGEVVDQYETVRRRKDGERIDVSLTVSPIRNPDGVVVGASSIGRDIRDRKRDREVLQAQRDALALANAELERSNADLDQFAAVASHDLRAPLRGMASLADWIIEDHTEALGEEGRRQLALLRERAERMHLLIEGILEYSRSGRKSALERVSSRESMLDILDALPRRSDVQVVVAADLPTVLYDQTQLTQVLQNLVGNAIQHMGRRQGRIEVFAREQGAHWEFCVADDGPGIPEAHRERIFRLFQTGSGAVRSSGVGLSVVKKIVEANGGRVWIANRDGGGAEFWFSVPKR